jgi:8-oxo-dGTP pyrophosphatase MutT (NUDIX family)
MPRRAKPAPKARRKTSKTGAKAAPSSAPKAKMEREFSAGGVVVRRLAGSSESGAFEIAVIEPRREDDGDKAKQVLALPKGWIDAGEKPDQTACREVREEAGIDCDVVHKLGDIKYVYVRKFSDNARVFKVVSFYLLRYTSGEIGGISEEMKHEVRGARWIPLADAPRLLAYKGEKDMVAKAAAYLVAHPEAL